MGLAELKPRFLEGCVPSGRSREDPVSLFFPPARGCLNSLAAVFRLQTVMVGGVFLTLCHSDTNSPVSLFYLQGLLCLHWAHLDNPAALHISRSSDYQP